MIKTVFICDRCGKEIEPGKMRAIAIHDMDASGELDDDNPFDGCHFCSKCVSEIMEVITKAPEAPKRGRKPKGIYTKNAKAMIAKG
jgi:DNA-directed RNA polymerase subunit RPC12/RpoP